MIKILFICHGNICRSPMSEFIFRDMVAKRGIADQFEMTNLLMKEADIILATGGPGMVKAAYSSGKPALGVGAGNTPAIIDKSADILKAVNSIIHSKTFDNGMICASEQSTIVDKTIYRYHYLGRFLLQCL